MDNASEVLTDVSVAAALSNVYEGMSVLVTYVPGSAGNLGLDSTDSNAKVRMVEGGYGEFLITVAWDYEAGLTTDNDKSTTLSIDISGKQYNSANVIDETETLAD